MLRTWLKSFGKLLYKHHMTLLLVGCLTHKSESFRLRFVLFAIVCSADLPLFPPSPARSNPVLGQKWVKENFTITNFEYAVYLLVYEILFFFSLSIKPVNKEETNTTVV